VIFFGNEVDIADQMQAWFEQGGSDGFMMALPILPESLTDITGKVVPELQRRGLFRTEYEGRTLRENLGLAIPQNRYIST